MTKEACKLCGYECERHPKTGDEQTYTCVVCGTYTLHGSLLATWEDDVRSKNLEPKLCNYVFLNPGSEVIGAGLTRKLETLAPYSPREQFNKLLQFLYKEGKGLAEQEISDGKLYAVLADFDRVLLKNLLNEIETEKLLNITTSVGKTMPRVQESGKPKSLESIYYSFTLKGIEYLESLPSSSNTNLVFVALEFKSAFDSFYPKYLKPIAESLKLEMKDIRCFNQAGSVNAQMEEAIRASKILVADVSYSEKSEKEEERFNANVFWEAGFAEGLGIPVIYFCQKETELPFDTRNHYHIFWNKTKPELAANEFKAILSNTLESLKQQKRRFTKSST